MSRTEIYRIEPNGDVVLHGGAKNSFRGAMLIWMQMARRYLRRDFNLMSRDGDQEVWDLFKSPYVPITERVMMASTFDRVIVRIAEREKFLHAIDEYISHNDPGNLLEQG